MKAPAIVLLGPPGAGKGTQAARVAQQLEASHLSSGELLRTAIETGSDLGLHVAPLLAAGQLVPTDLLLPILEAAVEQTSDDRAILFDGFPRSREQAILLHELLKRSGRHLLAALLLQVPKEELMARLLGRGRFDDDPRVVEERLAIYDREIKPLATYYRGQNLLYPIDGYGTPHEVSERLIAIVRDKTAY